MERGGSDLGRLAEREEEEEEEERTNIGGLFVLTHTHHSCTWSSGRRRSTEGSTEGREEGEEGGEGIWSTTVTLPPLPTQQAPTDATDGIRLRKVE